MKTKFHRWPGPMLLLLPVLAVNGQPAGAGPGPGKTVMSIDTGWQFREAGKTDWHPATVPGCVHTDLSADKFAKAVYLAVPDHDGFFSDNYFNLAPKREVTVQFRSSKPISLDEFRKRLQIRSVFDAF